MTSPPVEAAEPGTDVLRSAAAGGKVIRGGAIRAAGYGAGVLVGTGTAALLLRYLGVVDFGRYATVMALLGIVAGVTDAGLTAVGGREMSVRPPGEERRQLLASLVTLRIATAAVGVAGAVAFAAAAGYDSTLVLGTFVGGAGILLLSLQAMLTTPLWVELRIGTLTVLEVLKNLLTLAGVGVLVAAGTSLLPFFAVPVGVGLVVLALTPLLVGAAARLLPRLDRVAMGLLVREALPLALAVAMSVVYVRLLVVLASLLTSPRETGLFATSFRIFEVLLSAPAVLLSVALPVLSVAGSEDEERLRFGLQRMTEVALAASALVVLLVAVTAEAALRLLAGEEFVDAAPVLRVQSLALVPVFLGQAWQLGLISLRAQRAVAIANGAALAVVLALGLALIPSAGAMGAAWAAVAAEVVLAAILVAFLARGRHLSLHGGFALRTALATGAAGAVALTPGVGPWGAAALAAVVFVVVALAVGALPRELVAAVLAPLRRS